MAGSSVRPRPRRRIGARPLPPKRIYHQAGSHGSLSPRRSSWWVTQRHRLLGAGLLLLAIAVAGTHLAEHAGALRLFNPSWQDLLIGFPTAGILGMGGFIALIWK